MRKMTRSARTINVQDPEVARRTKHIGGPTARGKARKHTEKATLTAGVGGKIISAYKSVREHYRSGKGASAIMIMYTHAEVDIDSLRDPPVPRDKTTKDGHRTVG